MNSFTDFNKLGIRLREARKNTFHTQESLAELVDLSPAYVGQIERGEKHPALETLVNLAKHLNVSLDYLVWGDSIFISKNISDLINDVGEEEYKELARKAVSLVAECVKAGAEKTGTSKKSKVSYGSVPSNKVLKIAEDLKEFENPEKPKDSSDSKGPEHP